MDQCRADYVTLVMNYYAPLEIGSCFMEVEPLKFG